MSIRFFIWSICSGCLAASAQNPFPDTWTRYEQYLINDQGSRTLEWTCRYDRKQGIIATTFHSISTSTRYFPVEGDWTAYTDVYNEMKDSTYTTHNKKKRQSYTYRYRNGELYERIIGYYNRKAKLLKEICYDEKDQVVRTWYSKYLYDTLQVLEVRYYHYDKKTELNDSIVYVYDENNRLVSELKYDIHTHKVDTLLSSWYTYENNGKTRKYQSFDKRDGKIVPFRDFTEIKNDKGQRIEMIEDAPWYDIYIRRVYTYNEEGNSVEVIFYGRDGKPYMKERYEYIYYE